MDISDMIIIENKLSSATPLTKAQSTAFTKKSFIVRSIDKSSEMGTGLNLEQRSVIKFNVDKQVYKVHGDANGGMIGGIIKL